MKQFSLNPIQTGMGLGLPASRLSCWFYQNCLFWWAEIKEMGLEHVKRINSENKSFPLRLAGLVWDSRARLIETLRFDN